MFRIQSGNWALWILWGDKATLHAFLTLFVMGAVSHKDKDSEAGNFAVCMVFKF